MVYQRNAMGVDFTSAVLDGSIFAVLLYSTMVKRMRVMGDSGSGMEKYAGTCGGQNNWKA